MDETNAWSSMVGNVMVDITGTNDVPLKSTGNEKAKVSLSNQPEMKRSK